VKATKTARIALNVAVQGKIRQLRGKKTTQIHEKAKSVARGTRIRLSGKGERDLILEEFKRYE
jgi:hypothetical protein